MRRACCHRLSARIRRKRFMASPSSALCRWRAASKCPRRCLACWLLTCKGSSSRKVGVVFGWPLVGCFVFFLTGGSLDSFSFPLENLFSYHYRTPVRIVCQARRVAFLSRLKAGSYLPPFPCLLNPDREPETRRRSHAGWVQCHGAH